MKIGIFTYGTRGDVQPYIPLALGLKNQGHRVILSAPENFKGLVEGFGIEFHALYGNAEDMMNSTEGLNILKTENTIKLMQFFFKALNSIKVPLRKSYIEGVDKVDLIIANTATVPVISAIAERQNKKMALTYFMPPVVPTMEFPLGDFDFLNFPWYNQLSYKIAHFFFWKFVKSEVNEFREELGLPVLTESLITHIEKQNLLDLYCISPSLIPQPKDWPANHKITGFLTVPTQKDQHSESNSGALADWLAQGEKPVYIGFGSNGVGNPEKFIVILNAILNTTSERILFCTGWAQYAGLPQHERLFVQKYVDHNAVLPKCKLGIFHGGAGTLAAMLRNNLPVIIISFYTDQPTWGKIVERMKLGVHIPVKKLDAHKVIAAIADAQTAEVKAAVLNISEKLKNENGLERAIAEIEGYFGI